MTTNERFTGQVKFFNRDRGFGFVTRLDDKKDFFVHFQDIKLSNPEVKCWNILFQGEYIDFTIRQGPNGEQAGEVTGVRGGSLLCENHFNTNNIKNKKRKSKNDETQDEPPSQTEEGQ